MACHTGGGVGASGGKFTALSHGGPLPQTCPSRLLPDAPAKAGVPRDARRPHTPCISSESFDCVRSTFKTQLEPDHAPPSGRPPGARAPEPLGWMSAGAPGLFIIPASATA